MNLGEFLNLESWILNRRAKLDFAATDEERERLGKLALGDKARRGARPETDRLTLIRSSPSHLTVFAPAKHLHSLLIRLRERSE